MSVWDVPRTHQLPAGCSPALSHCTHTGSGRGPMFRRHDAYFGTLYFPLPAVACTHHGLHDSSASVHGAADRKSTSKFSLYYLTQADASGHEAFVAPICFTYCGPLAFRA